MPNIQITTISSKIQTVDEGKIPYLRTEGRKHPYHLLLNLNLPPAAGPECMNAIPSLPVIQKNHLLHCPPPNCHDCQHRKALDLQVLRPHQQVCHHSDHEPDESVQEPNRKALGAKLHPRTLVEEHELEGMTSARRERTLTGWAH
uniref:Uncharacterized protein n=1 Tax=Oryza brachyantha TaxID=4533 RepID=J3LQB3_ORYBR